MNEEPADVPLLGNGALPGLAHVEILLVASYGRAGSSRLMELLRLTKHAMVAGEFPYETRSVQAAVLLASGAGMVAGDMISFGNVDYPLARVRLPGETESDFRRHAVLELCHLWPYVNQPGVESLRIAEKSVGWQVVHQVLGSCHQARFVMLDRDPRDVFVSVLHFNRQRGYAAFGAEYGTDELARRIADFYVEAGNAITRWGAKAHTVRYAAMVTDPIGTIRGVTHSTGELTVDPRQIAELSSPQHVTSPSTVESIGRWRTEEAAWPHQFAVLAQAYERFLDVSRPDRQALT